MPLTAGTFGFDDYVAHIIAFLQRMGPGTHVVAVCQPCPAVLAAVALMAEAAGLAAQLYKLLELPTVSKRMYPESPEPDPPGLSKSNWPEPLMVLSTAADWGRAPPVPPSTPVMPEVDAVSKLPAEPGKLSDQTTVCALADKPPAIINPAPVAQAVLSMGDIFIIYFEWVGCVISQ